VFPAALNPLKDDSRVKEAFALQNQLLASRRASYQNEQGSYEENIAGLQPRSRATRMVWPARRSSRYS
jgi:hypothetical protein